jgi:hypothetical protein
MIENGGRLGVEREIRRLRKSECIRERQKNGRVPGVMGIAKPNRILLERRSCLHPIPSRALRPEAANRLEGRSQTVGTHLALYRGRNREPNWPRTLMISVGFRGLRD